MRMQEAGRLETCKQAVVNLSEDCLWNLLSSCSNVGEAAPILMLLHCCMCATANSLTFDGRHVSTHAVSANPTLCEESRLPGASHSIARH